MNTHNGHPSLKEVSLGDAEVRSQCSQQPPPPRCGKVCSELWWGGAFDGNCCRPKSEMPGPCVQVRKGESKRVLELSV